MATVKSIDTELAVVKNEVGQMGQLFAKLEIALDKITDVSNNIGQILATRNLMHELRSIDNFMQGKGNSFSKKNRSDFLNNLEQVIRSTK